MNGADTTKLSSAADVSRSTLGVGSTQNGAPGGGINGTSSLSSAKNSARKRKAWAAVLALLCMIAVGLVIAIVVVNVPHGNEDDANVAEELDVPESVVDSNTANQIADEIESTMWGEDDVLVGDAALMYEQALAESETGVAVRLAVRYADFVRVYQGDFNKAVDILNEYMEEVEDGVLLLEYYALLKNLYNDVADETMADYYDQLLTSALSEMPEDLMSNEKAESEE